MGTRKPAQQGKSQEECCKIPHLHPPGAGLPFYQKRFLGLYHRCFPRYNRFYTLVFVDIIYYPERYMPGSDAECILKHPIHEPHVYAVIEAKKRSLYIPLAFHIICIAIWNIQRTEKSPLSP